MAQEHLAAQRSATQDGFGVETRAAGNEVEGSLDRFDILQESGAEWSVVGRRCERAVVTAYRELRLVGSDDISAFQTCITLYRIHHPEASMNEARRLVAEWIDHHLVRKADGPTPGCDCD